MTLAPLVLGGCLLPVGVQIASLVADGVSLAATDKTLTDHGLSAVTSQDCAMWRVVNGEEICRDAPPPDAMVMVADADPVVELETETGPVELETGWADPDAFDDPDETGETNPFGTPETETADVEPAPEPPAPVVPVMTVVEASPPVEPEPAPAPIATNRLLTDSRETPTERHTREGGYPVPDTTVAEFSRSLDSRLRGNDNFSTFSVAKIVFQQPANTNGGTFFVIASFSRLHDARRFALRHKGLATQVLAGTAKGKAVFRVATGSVTKAERPAIRAKLAEGGIKDAWALTLKSPKVVIELAQLN